MIRKNWFSVKTSLFVICLLTVLTGMANVGGDGKVIKEERSISGFKGVSVHNAIHLIIDQGSTEKVTVEAEEDIMHHLYTEVSGGILKIGVRGSVNNTGEMNVYVTLKEINSIEAGSAARVECTGKIETGDLKISTGSASSVKMDLKCDKLEIRTSSASKIRISGNAQSIDTESSSASSIDLAELKAEKGEIEASSAASVKVQVTREVDAKASSGAGITITGNPSSKNSDSSSGGSVRFR
jgi:hypothetical protein